MDPLRPIWIWIRCSHLGFPFEYELDEFNTLQQYIPSQKYEPTYVPYRPTGLAVRVFTEGPGDRGSFPGRVKPKTQNMVFNAYLLNTQHYKVRIKGEFLSLRVFGLLSSSLLLFPQRFGWYVLQLSSGVCRTWEPTRNFELRPLLNPRGSPVLIPLTITGYKC